MLSGLCRPFLAVHLLPLAVHHPTAHGLSSTQSSVYLTDKLLLDGPSIMGQLPFGRVGLLTVCCLLCCAASELGLCSLWSSLYCLLLRLWFCRYLPEEARWGLFSLQGGEVG